MIFIRPGDLQRRLFFSIFTHVFAYLPHFTIISYVEQIKNCLSGCTNIANTKNSKTLLTECIVSVFSGHTGVITCAVKEESAPLHIK